MKLPIACNLEALSPEQRLREQQLLAEFKAVHVSVQPIEWGFRFDVPGEPMYLARLAELLALERLCCPFLTFELRMGPGLAPVVLDVRGEDGAAQSFVRQAFGGRE